MKLSENELLRFSRQLPLLGIDGQEKLKQAKVLVIGAGGLGSPALLYLVGAGVGNISIVDGDTVELSNLHRQILFIEQDIKQNKAIAAATHLHLLNPLCHLQSYAEFITPENADELLKHCDVVIDASDNYATRYLVNAICRRFSIPLVSASLFQFEAQLSVFNYQNGPCYECLYPQAPPDNFIPNCAEGGILGALPGILGSLQAMEVLKIISQRGEILSGKLLTLDLLNHHYKTFTFTKAQFCSLTHCHISKQAPIPLATHDVITIEPRELAKILKQSPENYFLLDVRMPYEHEICHLGGALIPLAELEQNLHQIPLDKTIITYCKKGVRSQEAALKLIDHGFAPVMTLAGGILAWIETVDQHLTRY